MRDKDKEEEEDEDEIQIDVTEKRRRKKKTRLAYLEEKKLYQFGMKNGGFRRREIKEHFYLYGEEEEEEEIHIWRTF